MHSSNTWPIVLDETKNYRKVVRGVTSFYVVWRHFTWFDVTIVVRLANEWECYIDNYNTSAKHECYNFDITRPMSLLIVLSTDFMYTLNIDHFPQTKTFDSYDSHHLSSDKICCYYLPISIICNVYPTRHRF